MPAIDTSERALILAIDDDRDQRRICERFLDAAGFAVQTCASGGEGLLTLERCLPDAVLLDMQMEGMSGMEVLRRIKETHPEVPVIILTGDADIRTVMEATREGAYDYIVKHSADRARLVAVVRNAVESHRLRGETRRLRRAVAGKDRMIGEAPCLARLRAQIERVAPRDVTVLIHGESGVGKELVAQAIHERSPRAAHPLVAVNCGAITEGIQGSELFGHEKGAFTGAISSHIGFFEKADRGTLFLDEVAELSLQLQVSLLRVLQQRRFVRVGGREEVSTDIRIIAASHRSLTEAVEQGRFREDLYFRLAVFEMEVPPLRERGEDILLLAQQFLREQSSREKIPLPQMSPEFEAALMRWHWPGNVRELQNVVSSALIQCTGRVLERQHLTPRIQPSAAPPAQDTPHTARQHPPPLQPAPPPAQDTPQVPRDPPQSAPPRQMEEIKRSEIEAALRRNGQNRSRACQELGIPRTTFYRLLKRYDLEK